MMKALNGVRAGLIAAAIALALHSGAWAARAQSSADAGVGSDAAATAVLDPAPDAPLDRVTLVTGETLAGRVTADDGETITLLHPVLGELTIPRSRITEVVLAPAPPAPAGEPQIVPVDPSAAGASLSIVQPADGDPIEPAQPEVKWSGRLELGANGASGNSDANAFYIAFGVKRETALSTLTDDLSYRLATNDGVTTTNRFFNSARYERQVTADSRWSWFAQTSQEVDEFKDYDLRLSGSGGLGYDAVKNDRTTLTLYGGAGAAREFGGSDVTLNPFALLGAGYTRKINTRVSFRAAGEFEPRLDDFGEYRLRGKAGLDVDLNESGSLKLTLGIEDEFDSDPGTARKNDFYYTAAVVYSF